MYIKQTSSIIIVLLMVLMTQLQLTYAQQETPPDSTQTTSQAEDEEKDSPSVFPAQTQTQPQPQTQPDQNLNKSNSKDDKGFFSKLKFWGSDTQEAPREKSKLHELARFHYQAEKHEYYRFGYAKINEQWTSVFLLRRFKMIDRQYQHFLVIQGKPSKESLPKGMDIINLNKVSVDVDDQKVTVLQIRNIGFEFEMPRIPSTSREQKEFDENEALQLAGMQIAIIGFEDHIWLPDNRRDLSGIADTWEFQIE